MVLLSGSIPESLQIIKNNKCPMKITYTINGEQFTSEVITYNETCENGKKDTVFTVMHDGKEINIPENNVIKVEQIEYNI